MISIRPLTSSDHAAALALNNAAVPAVNAHDIESFARLVAQAERCWVAQDADSLAGLLVAFGPGSAYGSANYRWMCAHYDAFLYVDRIIVATSHKRRGVGSRFYETLEQHAAVVQAPRLVCEDNTEPPNPQSVAFHTAAGWRPIGDQRFGPDKAVRYFEKRLR